MSDSYPALSRLGAACGAALAIGAAEAAPVLLHSGAGPLALWGHLGLASLVGLLFSALPAALLPRRAVAPVAVLLAAAPVGLVAWYDHSAAPTPALAELGGWAAVAVPAALLAAFAPPRAALALFVALLGGIPLRRAPEPPRESGRPNVLLVVADTLRADHLGVYGYPRPTTPFLDQASKGATVWEQAFAAYSASTASHGAIQTGCYPGTHGATVNGMDLRPEVSTIAQHFKDEGYHTAAFLDHQLLSVEHGFSRGFDVFVEVHHPSLPGTRPAVWTRELNLVRALDVARRTEVHTPTLLAADYLEDPPEPFFAWVVLAQPHSPYRPPADLRERLVPARDSRMDGRVAKSLDPAKLSEDDVAYMRELYDAEVAWVDRSMEQLFAALGPRAADTIVVFTADHGEAFGEHGVYFHHGSLHDESIRVPLITWGLGPGGRVSTPVSLVDIATTLAGVPICDGAPLGQRDPVLSWKGGEIAATTAGYRLIQAGWPAGPWALYDLAADPREEHPLVDLDPAGAPAAVAQRLRAGIDAVCNRADLREWCGGASGAQVDMDEATRKALEAMGYLDAQGKPIDE